MFTMVIRALDIKTGKVRFRKMRMVCELQIGWDFEDGVHTTSWKVISAVSKPKKYCPEESYPVFTIKVSDEAVLERLGQHGWSENPLSIDK